MSNIKHFIITHKNCADGALAAGLLGTKLNMPVSDIFQLGHCNSDHEVELANLEDIGFIPALKEAVKSGKYDGIHLFVTDHMLQLETMDTLLTNYKNLYITTIDHHATALSKHAEYEAQLSKFDLLVPLGSSDADIRAAKKEPRAVFYISKEYSGAGLVWLYCMRHPYIRDNSCQLEKIKDDMFIKDVVDIDCVDRYINMMPELVRYVQDADTWQWRFRNDSEPFTLCHHTSGRTPEAIYNLFDSYAIACNDKNVLREKHESLPKLTEIFDSCLNPYIQSSIVKGKAAMEYRQGLIDSAKKSATTVYFNYSGRRVKGVFINTHLALSSHLGNQMVEPYTRPDGTVNDIEFAIIYAREVENGVAKYSCSIRSRNDNVDCSRIAGLFGGGGHKQASGFKIYGDEKFIEMFNDFVKGNIAIYNTVRDKLLSYLKIVERMVPEYTIDSLDPQTQIDNRTRFIHDVYGHLGLSKEANRISAEEVYYLLKGDLKLASALRGYFSCVGGGTKKLSINKWWVLPIFCGGDIVNLPFNGGGSHYTKLDLSDTTNVTWINVLTLIWSKDHDLLVRAS